MFYLYYRESVIHQIGWLFGAYGTLTYDGDTCERLHCSLLRAGMRFGYGEVDYDGQTWGGDPVVGKGQDEILVETRGLIAGKAKTMDQWSVMPYAGVGYRLLNNHAEENLGGYERLAHYVYSPLGIELTPSETTPWQVSATFEYDLFWIGRQVTRLSDLQGSGYADLSNYQHNGYGFRTSLKFERQTQHWLCIIEPYYIFWDVEDSEREDLVQFGSAVGYAWEPANETEEIGIRVLFRHK